METLIAFPDAPETFQTLHEMPEEDIKDSEGKCHQTQHDPDWVFHGTEIISSSPAVSIRSSQSSPSEIGGDSGVCSEHDTPPPSNRKHLAKTVTASDSDNDSSVSCESNQDSCKENVPVFPTDVSGRIKNQSRRKTCRIVNSQSKLPDCLLREIKEKSRELKRRRQASKSVIENGDRCSFNRSSSYQKSGRVSSRIHSLYNSFSHDISNLSLTDSSNYSSMTSLCTEDEDFFPSCASSDFYKKPLYECRDESAASCFAGFNDIFAPHQDATIKSSKGTVRGVKNRVRAGIATFTSDHRFLKLYAEREKGKVVIYVTTLGVVRDTYERCLRLRKILWTLLVHFEEKDVFMSRDTQIQLLDRLRAKTVSVPHVFLEGRYLGGVELIEKLNETGELRRLLHPYMRPASTTPCDTCGGFRLLPCSACSGSKKSVHRNNFTLEFVALKCSACDESGLIVCQECLSSS